MLNQISDYMRIPVFTLIVSFIIGGSTSWANPEITITDPWVREAPPQSSVSAAYMIIENSGTTDHVVVIVGVVRDISGHILLFQAPDPVFQAGCAGHDPRPRERLGVTLVREVWSLGIVRFRGVIDFDRLDGVEIGQQPRLGAVGEIAIGEEQHRTHAVHGEAERLHGHVEAV